MVRCAVVAFIHLLFTALLSANILLDEHLKAKIADFNLAKEATGINDTGKYTHITKKQMTEVMYGSKAYLPSDFFTNEATFSTSTDVFSFGMVRVDLHCYHSNCLHIERNKTFAICTATYL